MTAAACHWCPNDATTQMTKTIVHRPNTSPERVIVPCCELCARTFERERWYSITAEMWGELA